MTIAYSAASSKHDCVMKFDVVRTLDSVVIVAFVVMVDHYESDALIYG